MFSARYLPSKRFSFTAGALIVGGGLILGAYIWGNAQEPLGTLSLDDVIAKAAELDSDGDGLKDWEESIRGTDPQNPDTDGDGTLDGDEITFGRDPTKPGPDDRLASEDSAAYVYKPEEDVTEDVSKAFLDQYLKLREEGALDETTQRNLVVAIAKRIAVDIDPIVHKEGDFASVADSAENRRVFGNVFVEAALRHQDYASYISVLNAVGLALESDGVEGRKAFELAEDAHRALLDEHLRIPVPKAVSADYLVFLNFSEETLAAIPHMRKVASDPLRAMAALQRYQDKLAAATLVLKRVAAKLDPDGILFSKDEPGYQLRNLQSVPQ